MNLAWDGGTDFDGFGSGGKAGALDSQAIDAVGELPDHGTSSLIGRDGLVQLVRFAGELECRRDGQTGGIAHLEGTAFALTARLPGYEANRSLHRRYIGIALAVVSAENRD